MGRRSLQLRSLCALLSGKHVSNLAHESAAVIPVNIIRLHEFSSIVRLSSYGESVTVCARDICRPLDGISIAGNRRDPAREIPSQQNAPMCLLALHCSRGMAELCPECDCVQYNFQRASHFQLNIRRRLLRIIQHTLLAK